MDKRLRLARRLLKPDGALIVTIDEHEVQHLGVLLEQLFPEADCQVVTIVTNAKGSPQPRFYRVEEYAFFVSLGSAEVFEQLDDHLTFGADGPEAGQVPGRGSGRLAPRPAHSRRDPGVELRLADSRGAAALRPALGVRRRLLR